MADIHVPRALLVETINARGLMALGVYMVIVAKTLGDEAGLMMVADRLGGYGIHGTALTACSSLPRELYKR